MDDYQERLSAARIPPHAFKTTLTKAKQVLARSIIEDRGYQSQGILKSISLLQPASGLSDNDFSTICARFAAELCLVQQSVLYAPVATLQRELQRYSAGGDLSDMIHPVITHKGFLVVPDLDDAPEGSALVHSFLLEYASASNALVVARRYCRAYVDGRKPLPPDLDAFLDNASVPVPLVPFNGKKA